MNPPLEQLMSVASVAESCVPALSLLAYVPQWRKLMQSRDSSSISLASWVIWAVSYVIAIFYAVTLLLVTGRGWPLVATTSLGLCFVLITIALVSRYREPEGRDQQSNQATH